MFKIAPLKKVVFALCFAICNVPSVASAAFLDAKENGVFAVSGNEQPNAAGNRVYLIRDAWVHEGNAYLSVVNRKVVAHPERFSYLNPHDSHTEYIDENIFLKLPLDWAGAKRMVDLSSGTSFPGLIYIDSDFSISANNGSVVVRNRNQRIATTCRSRIWHESNAVRFDDSLFYCGVIYPVLGRGYAKLPSQVESEISKFVGQDIGVIDRPNVPYKFRPTVFVVREGRNLNIAVNRRIDPTKMDTLLSYVAVSIDSPSIIQIKTLPFVAAKFAFIHDSRIYSNDGFILMNADVSTIAICGFGRCKFINRKYGKLSDSLVVNFHDNIAFLIGASYPSNVIGKFEWSSVQDIYTEQKEVVY